MKRKKYAKIVTSVLLNSLSLSVMTQVPQAVLASENTETAYTDGRPWMDSNIDGVVTPDMETNLKDDFYLAVNKDKILNMQYVDGDEKASNTFSIEYTISKNVYDLIVNDDPQTEEMYGRIGSIIGHEISHAFDSKGSQYDPEGNMRDWWTESDKKKFKEKIEKVREYFNGVSIYGDKMLDGRILDGEATADITSIECLLHLAKGIPDFDYDLFFRSYADMWAMKETVRSAEEDYMYDVHPPVYLRVNAVIQQFDEFLDTFDIAEGDGMYLAPEERIIIW